MRFEQSKKKKKFTAQLSRAEQPRFSILVMPAYTTLLRTLSD
jgi:hypothetical protein